MLMDARDLPDGAVLEADVCIVGSGPVAIGAALGLDHPGLRVVMLEAGGVDPSADPEPDGAGAGVDPAALRFGTVTRIEDGRRFAGNASAWLVRTGTSWHGVRLLPLAAADFEPRPWLPGSGWPIGIEALAAPLARAAAIFGLPPDGFGVEAWAGEGARPFALPGGVLRTGMFQFGDGDVFVRGHRATLARSATVTVCYHAQAVELLGGARVEGVAAASAPGRRLRVRAGRVVLAGGGMSPTRLLLASAVGRAGEAGNRHDLVGRHFMDHPLIYGGELVPASPALFEEAALYDMRTVRGTPVMGHLALTDAALRERDLPNLSLMLFPRERNWQSHRRLSPRQEAGFEAVVRLRRAWLRRRRPPAADLLAAVHGADGVARRLADRALFPKSNLARGGWSALSRKARRFDRFEVLHQVEQAPHRDNRLYLSAGRDALGMPRLGVDWRWHDADAAAVARAQEAAAAALRDAGLGRFEIAREGGRPVVLASSTGHFMGATRMSRDPARGVVDPDGRVHGTENLYVTGSGVFPTGGFANPTLTAVALAVRLADHLLALHGLPPAPAAGTTAPQPALAG